MSAVEWTGADLARSIYADEEVQQAIATVVNEVPEAFVSRAHIADLTLRTVAPFVAAREAQAADAATLRAAAADAYERGRRDAVAQADPGAYYADLRAALADMTRQRDEAVKAFQRERARVGRVEAVAQEYEELERQEGYGGEPWGTTAACIREALADRPADD